jgi:hypothetical protein
LLGKSFLEAQQYAECYYFTFKSLFPHCCKSDERVFCGNFIIFCSLESQIGRVLVFGVGAREAEAARRFAENLCAFVLASFEKLQKSGLIDTSW